MNKLIRKTVYKILDEDEKAREDDNYLIFKVVQELEPELAGTTFANVMFNLGNKQISLESITRARRKIQSKYPELTNKKIASFRDKKQKEFIAYSRKV